MLAVSRLWANCLSVYRNCSHQAQHSPGAVCPRFASTSPHSGAVLCPKAAWNPQTRAAWGGRFCLWIVWVDSTALFIVDAYACLCFNPFSTLSCFPLAGYPLSPVGFLPVWGSRLETVLSPLLDEFPYHCSSIHSAPFLSVFNNLTTISKSLGKKVYSCIFSPLSLPPRPPPSFIGIFLFAVGRQVFHSPLHLHSAMSVPCKAGFSSQMWICSRIKVKG